MPRTGENIFERKDGRFEGRYIASRDENGKAKYACVYGKSRQEVQEKLAEVREKRWQEGLEGVYTFSRAFADWLNKRAESLNPASVDRYAFLINRYALREFGDMDAASITPAQIGKHLAFLANKEERGEDAIGGTTLENLESLLRSIVSFARGDSRVPQELRKLYSIEKRSYKALSEQEIRRLVDCAKYNRCPEMLGVLLALYTGIGTGELCALSWDDVDQGRREIFIHQTLYRIQDKDSEKARTKLEIMNVSRSHVRTVVYPEALGEYVKEQCRAGTFFLTGEKKFMEQKTFCNRLEKRLSTFQLKDITLQRINRTFRDGMADTRYLVDPFFLPQAGREKKEELDEKWLLKEMEHDLKPLRGILGLSAEDMGSVLDRSAEDYLALEEGEETLGWNEFLSLLFFFRYNSKTEAVVEALGLYPKPLKARILNYPGKKADRNDREREALASGGEE